MSAQKNTGEVVTSAVSITAWLDRWSWFYDIFGFVILSNILKFNTEWFTVFRRWEDFLSWGSWGKYAEIAGMAPVVGVAIIAIFYIGKSHAKASVENVVDLFSSGFAPQNIYGLKDRTRITAMLVLNFVNFVALMSFINHTIILSLLFLFLYIFYCISNLMQNKNIKAWLKDPVFQPWDKDPHLQFIKARRVGAEKYLGKHHLSREMIMIVASTSALVTSILDWYGMLPHGSTVAYALLVTGVVVNEAIVGMWRREHFRELDKISAAQVNADIHDENRRRERLGGAKEVEARSSPAPV